MRFFGSRLHFLPRLQLVRKTPGRSDDQADFLRIGCSVVGRYFLRPQAPPSLPAPRRGFVKKNLFRATSVIHQRAISRFESGSTLT